MIHGNAPVIGGSDVPLKLSGAGAAGVALEYAAQDHQHGSAIVGVTDGGSALAGEVGEGAESIVAVGSAIAKISGTNQDVTSLLLPAGDWAVSGSIMYISDPATSSTVQAGSLNIVSTSPSFAHNSAGFLSAGGMIGHSLRASLPSRVFRFAVPTSIFLVAQATFTLGALSVYGSIRARRVR